MIYFAFVNQSTGDVSQVIQRTQLYSPGQQVGDYTIHQLESDKSTTELAGSLYYKEGLREKPIAPTPYHTWCIESESYEVKDETIAMLKREKKRAISARRHEMSRAVIQHQIYFWGADDESVKNISGKLQELAAKDALGLAVDVEGLFWMDALNNLRRWDSVEHYKIFLQSLTVAIAERTSNLYQIAWQQKAELDALTDIEAVLAYDVDAGWSVL